MSNARSGALSDTERQAWQRDGYFVRPGVFGARELNELTAAVETAASRAHRSSEDGRPYWLDGKRFVDTGYRTMQYEHQADSQTLRVVEPIHDLHPRLDALADDPRITAPMSALVGTPDITLWTDKLNLKRPREGSGFGWHQDSPYWVHDCDHVDQLPNVMITLDEAHAGNGCFRVIRGSHTQGCLPGTDDGTQLGGFFTSPQAYRAEDEVALTVPAGTLIFFSPHIVHGSGPNPSDEPRRALIYTYQPAGYAMLKSGLFRRPGAGVSRAGRVLRPVG